jgi:hypothetical protein
MFSEDHYFNTMSEEDLWKRYCGFLDLSLEEFMSVQRELLTDEIGLVGNSILGKKIMGNQRPRTVEEFRRLVPLTTYNDYEPYLNARQEDALGAKPHFWCHTAGRSGQFKWIPQSSEVVDKAVRSYLGSFILAASNRRGEVNIAPGDRLLTLLPPPPYTTGSVMQSIAQRISLRIIPPLDMSGMDFQERIKTGFQMALEEDIDIIGSVVGILVRMGREFSGQTRKTRMSPYMARPKVIWRYTRAWLRSKRAKRPMLPKDLWQPKAILAGGLDTSIYKDDIAYYWGKPPYEVYAGTEALIYALQAWNRRGLTFLPDTAFWEFIPQSDKLDITENSADKFPRTVLFNELEKDKLYEVVLTQLYGMPLLRYRMNDIIKVVSLEDRETGIKLPQVVFQRKAGEVINLGNMVHLDEKSLWQAVANCGVNYTEWCAFKDFNRSQALLHIYIELKEEMNAKELEKHLDEQLKLIDADYKDVEIYLKYWPLKVSLLSPGTFRNFAEERKKNGAEMTRLKPAHVNAPENELQQLQQISEALKVK